MVGERLRLDEVKLFFTDKCYCQNIRWNAHMMLVVNASNDGVQIILTFVFCSFTVTSAGSLGQSAGADTASAITKQTKEAVFHVLDTVQCCEQR